MDLAFGGDQGGSVRIPSAWCGCVGLMATHGLIPHTGVFGLEPTIDYTGPMTRTVDDLAAVLDCVAGRDGYDPRQASVPEDLPRYRDALGRGVEGLRIGLLEEGFGVENGEPVVDDAVREAVAVLEQAGATVRTVSVPESPHRFECGHPHLPRRSAARLGHEPGGRAREVVLPGVAHGGLRAGEAQPQPTRCRSTSR